LPNGPEWEDSFELTEPRPEDCPDEEPQLELVSPE